MSSHKGRTSCDYAPHCAARPSSPRRCSHRTACPPRPAPTPARSSNSSRKISSASSARSVCSRCHVRRRSAPQAGRRGQGLEREEHPRRALRDRSLADPPSRRDRCIARPVAGHRGQPAGSVRPGRLDQPPLRRPSSTHRPGDPAAADGHRRHGAHPPGGGASRRAAGGRHHLVARRLHSPPPQPRAGPADVGTATRIRPDPLQPPARDPTARRHRRGQDLRHHRRRHHRSRTPRQSYTLFADNAGRDTIGEGRLGLLARYTNPFGVDDSLQVLATTSEGSKNVSLAYSAEVARSGLRMDASISVGTVKVIAGTFAPLDITGESRDFSLGLSKPLEVSLERMWKLYGRWSMRDSRTEFGGFQQSDLDLRLITLGISGEARNDSRAWYTDHAIAAGIPYLGGERSFAYYRGSATRFDRLSDRLQLVLRGGLQFSDTRFLPASEQFQIGGAYTVRGFSEGLLSGRSGYFGSVELRLAQSLAEYMQESAMPPSLQWVAFIDHGGALPYRPGILKEVGKDDFHQRRRGRAVRARQALQRPPQRRPADPRQPRRGPRPPAPRPRLREHRADAGLARRFALEKPWISRPGIRLAPWPAIRRAASTDRRTGPGLRRGDESLPNPVPETKAPQPTGNGEAEPAAASLLQRRAQPGGRRELSRRCLSPRGRTRPTASMSARQGERLRRAREPARAGAAARALLDFLVATRKEVARRARPGQSPPTESTQNQRAKIKALDPGLRRATNRSRPPCPRRRHHHPPAMAKPSRQQVFPF